MRLRATVATCTLATLILAAGFVDSAAAQTSAGKQPAKTAPAKAYPAKAPAATAAVPLDPADAAKKAEILKSQRWRRAMFELNEWFSTQKIYNKQQAAQMKANLSAHVAKMSAAEVQAVLDDLDAKFQVLDTPEAQEARAWMAQYLSYFSDKKRKEMLKDVPNVATMTASQLAEEIRKIEQKRASIERDQALFNQRQQAEAVAAQQTRAATQAAFSRPAVEDAASFSPYRNTTSTKKPFDDVHRPGDGMQFFMTSGGRFGYTFNPSSW